MGQIRQYQMFIDGEFVHASNYHKMAVINPATEDVISEVPEGTAADARAAVEAAFRAQPKWARLAPVERGQYLRKIAQAIRDNQETLARVIAEEQGKVLPLARTEVAFTADYMDYMAEWARRYEGEIIPSDRRNEHILLFKAPIGVVAGILPWNFPFFLIARKMAPALVTGNTIVIKPSEDTPNNALEFATLVAQSGLPRGVFNVVTGDGPTVGQELAAHPKVGMVSLTGSYEAGASVMRAAAENITKVSLELGGKAPAIVMDDADLELAVRSVVASRIINTGQVCNCAERVYVHAKVYDEFVERVADAMSQTTFGDPLAQPDVDMGPLINRTALESVERKVNDAVREGAKVVTGGRRADLGRGYHYEPTVLVQVKQGMEIMRKETFGPVLPVMKFYDLDEALELANDCEYGLTSSIYTQNLDVAMRACAELKFGETYVNRENFEAMQGFHAGWRRSGIGGADGKHGLEEFLQTHVVYIQYNSERR
ncbi:MAG: aldehyde dehydrogenase [Alicyclobacillus sp.]|nr:aldehyde dehydrogenase [Alicyclobacillus sp.]